jgi:hypothetical protein
MSPFIIILFLEVIILDVKELETDRSLRLIVSPVTPPINVVSP